MKNIHVLPTAKYSDLVFSTSKYGGYFLSRYYYPKDMGDFYQNIHITNSEKIEKGDWVFNPIYKTVYQWIKNANIVFDRIDAKKIILTTDQDLIKAGVQAIDNEFLEWFVKNPSCEFVDIYNDKSVGYEYDNYSIIIPKEEPKKIDHSKVIKVLPRMVKESFPKKQSKQEKSMKDIAEELAEIAIILTNNSANYQETLEEVAPMEELVIILHKIKKNLTNKTEVLTIKLITDTIKTQFVDKELKWQQKTIEEVFEWLTTNNYLKETLIEQFKNK